jgi:hypothetical protein
MRCGTSNRAKGKALAGLWERVPGWAPPALPGALSEQTAQFGIGREALIRDVALVRIGLGALPSHRECAVSLPHGITYVRICACADT